MGRLTVFAFAAALVSAFSAAASEEGAQLDAHPGYAALVAELEVAEHGLADGEAETALASLVLDVQAAHEAAASGDFHEYREWREATCPGCQTMRIARLPYFFDAALLRRLGYRWHDKTRLGMAFNSGVVRYGFWGDVREVNSIVNGRTGLVPTLSTVQTSSGPTTGAQFAGLAASGQGVVVDSGGGSGSFGLGSGGGSAPSGSMSSTIVVDAGPSISPGGGTSVISSGGSGSSGSGLSVGSGGGLVVGSTGSIGGTITNSTGGGRIDVGSGSVGTIGGDIRGGGAVVVNDSAPPVTNSPSTPVVNSGGSGGSGTGTSSPSSTPTAISDIGLSNIRARGAAGSDPAYTEYIAGFFVAAPF